LELLSDSGLESLEPEPEPELKLQLEPELLDLNTDLDLESEFLELDPEPQTIKPEDYTTVTVVSLLKRALALVQSAYLLKLGFTTEIQNLQAALDHYWPLLSQLLLLLLLP